MRNRIRLAQVEVDREPRTSPVASDTRGDARPKAYR